MVNIVLYEDKYREQLEKLLTDFSTEVFKCGKSDVDYFIESHNFIYMALDGNSVIGFSSFAINDYCGLRESTIGNDYIYIIPEKRSSKAMYLFSLQAGKVCIENNIELEHYYSSDISFRHSKKLKGREMYKAYIYGVDEIKNTFSKLTKKVNIK